jgi:heat shock protein HtpX
MTHYQAISANKQRSWLVVIGFVLFITISSYFMAVGFGYGLDVVGWALIASGIMSFGSYYFSDSMILSISGARPAERDEFFDFYTVAENLAMSQRLPMPKLYVIDDTAMNAFATGRDPEHAVICATTGILSRLNRAELEGVIAHEMSHIANYDIRLMSIVTILVGLVSLLADWMLRMQHHRGDDDDNGGKAGAILFFIGLAAALLSPIIAQLIQLAISRQREYLADASGAGITKNPSGLAKALRKLSTDTEPLEAANKATAHLYIADPLKNISGGRKAFASLFQTHPPIEERIAILEKMAHG